MSAPTWPMLAAALCLASAQMACTRPAVVTAPPPYSFEMSVGGFEIPEDGVEIVYEDEVLGRVKPHAPVVRITLPHDVYLVDAKGRLRARVEGSCGKQDIPLRIPYSDRQEELAALRLAAAKPAMFQVDNPTVVRLYYDNDSGPANTLSIGTRVIHVAAGGKGVSSVVLGSCATGRQIVVGGMRVGDVPPQGGMEPTPPTTLVDMTGGHCYRRRVHAYGLDGAEKKLEPRAAKPALAKNAVKSVDAGAPGSADERLADEATFKGQRIYSVGTIHDLFTPSPTTFLQREDAKTATRIELQRCDRGKIVPSPTSSTPVPAAPPPPRPAAAPAKAKSPAPAAPAKAPAKKK